ncbi:uncharacterized protein PHACADRAFT_160926 [Phanerochaete carnosa HHB-10118-sp]|uniref:Cyclin N-terminal domain-containing protein n=1 Tax=Phanerochaete carnosa (strain HHB-10118-sp) TaxID=650164 RepID=K5WWY7_PHACS|nr:uncharacterized protein PHACADRAFT_160926 [Phanerochaete carnosa HHB-10118-sp]EKM54987.1 hypothetical protein PHACADRAFT_160926 [Phanerochaete carnosa HHB-10118-sp]
MVQGGYSPVHEASLVDPALHSPAVLELLDVKMSRTLIEYVVDCVVETVDYAMGRPSSSRGRSSSRQQQHSTFLNFVNNLLTKAEVKVPVLLVALVYIDRAKPHLQIALEQWACERVFLGALILANKYTNDSTLKNVHWALCTGVFGKRDVGRIEREFLDVLDYELTLHESDLLSHHDAIMSIVAPARFALRTHHTVSEPATPRNHHRSHRKASPPPSLPSRWSVSTDSDSDHSTSPSQSPMPLTPPHADVEPTYVAAISASPEPIVAAAAPEPHPTPAKAKSVEVVSHPPHSHRRFSALHNMLRSFPIPHFHHSSSSSSSASSLASVSPVSATSSSSSSIPRYKAVAPACPATIVAA